MSTDRKTPLTVGGKQVGLELTPGTEASLPAASVLLAGARYRTTDTGVVFICDGTAWTVEDYDMNVAWNGGQLYESVPRSVGGGWAGAQALTSGVAQANGIFLPKGAVIGFLALLTGSTAMVTGTHWWLALYDPSLNLLAYTADQTSTAPGTNNYVEKAIAKNAAGGTITSFTITASGIYYIDIMFAATTVPTLRGQTMGIAGWAAGGDNSGAGKASMKSATFTHGTGLTYPPPAAITTRANVSAPDWVGART